MAHSYRSALRTRDLRLLLGALTLSIVGSWAYGVALAAFVFDRTGSLSWVAAAALARFVTGLLTSPYAGVLAERAERIRLMVTSDVLCALWMAALAVTAAADGPLTLLIALVVLTAVSNVVYAPAVSAMIPAVAREKDLVAANALNGTIENLAIIAGPAIGALVLVLGPAWVVFALNAVTFAASALIVSRIHTRSRPVDVTHEGTAGIMRQLSVGFATIAADRSTRTLVGFCALVSFMYGTDTVLFLGVSEQHLGIGSEGFGYLVAGLGVGGVIMAFAVDRLAASHHLAWIILLGVAGYALPTALLTVIESPVLASVVQVVRGASTLVVDVLAVTALQRAVPQERLARVFGVFFAVTLGATSLGALLTPPLVNGFDLDTVLIVMAVGPVAVALLGLPSLLRIDRATAGRAAELAPVIAVLEQVGIFATASRPVLERLAGSATALEFPSRAVIVAEGDAADGLYVLVEGEVLVRARGEFGDAQPRPLRTMTAPTYFGEIGVLDGIPRTATVIAAGPCRCLRIDGDLLLEALATIPPSSGLIENASRRLALTHPTRRVTLAAVPEAAD